MNTHTLEIWGENNSFTVDATVDYEPYEDFLTGKVHYNSYLASVKLVHGTRRREVINILPKETAQELLDRIDRIELDMLQEHLGDVARNSYEDRFERSF